MANRKVSLFIRIKEGGERPFVKPVIAANGRIRPLCALVDGVPQHRPEGTYYLRWPDGNRRVWEPVGVDPYAALAAELRREHIFESKSMGIPVVEENKANRTTLADAIQKYLVRIHLHNGYRSQNEYDLMLPQFADICGKTYLDEITGEDLLHFVVRLRDMGLADRTVSNRVGRVLSFLKTNGITGLLAPHERPRYDEKVVEAYNTDELNGLFEAAEPEDRLVFQFFLGSGCREAEVANATWRDLTSRTRRLRATASATVAAGQRIRKSAPYLYPTPWWPLGATGRPSRGDLSTCFRTPWVGRTGTSCGSSRSLRYGRG